MNYSNQRLINNHDWFDQDIIQNSPYTNYKCKKCRMLFTISKYESEHNPSKYVLKNEYNLCENMCGPNVNAIVDMEIMSKIADLKKEVLKMRETVYQIVRKKFEKFEKDIEMNAIIINAENFVKKLEEI
jgi:hypothetical protein